MNNFIIINLQAAVGTISLYLLFKWWIQPRIANLSVYQALLPFVFLNAFRYLGLSFIAKEQFYSGFPNEFLMTVGIWDLATAVFALVASLALKSQWRIAIPLVWVFNFFGFADLATAFPKFFSLKLYDHDLGFIWLMFVTYGLAAFLSHIYIFFRLIKHSKEVRGK